MVIRMRRLRLAAVLLVALSPAAGAGAANDPRDEQERPTAADTAFARRVVLERADLGPGWVLGPALSGGEANEPFSCPGFDPDFSAFTITGEAETSFRHAGGAALFSLAEVFPSRAQAAGDFRTGAKPAVAGCLRFLLERELAAAADRAPFRMRVASSTMRRAPGIGERAVSYRVVMRVEAGDRSLPVYVDVLVFQQGRSLGALMAIAPLQPVPAQSRLAAKMVARMR
jgi:hypothetical protein